MSSPSTTRLTTPPTTIDDFLGGAVRLEQPRDGYRVAMDTVLLASAIPAKAGDTILEPGIGTAGAALCLTSRIKGVTVHGFDASTEMLDFAHKNIARNGFKDRITVAEGCVTHLDGDGSSYDHVMMNPPFLKPGSGRAPKGETKTTAHMNATADLSDWLRLAVHHTKARGSITIVHRADQLDKIITGLSGPCGDICIFPLWPGESQPAKRVIIQALKGSKGPSRLLAGLCLHGPGERYTEAASRVLMDGAALDLASSF